MEDVRNSGIPVVIEWSWWLCVLVGLTVFDGMATDIGLRFGAIEEANPLMSFVYGRSIFLFYLMKEGFPLVLFAFLSTIANSRILKNLVRVTVVLYGLIAGVHLFWLWLHFS